MKSKAIPLLALLASVLPALAQTTPGSAGPVVVVGPRLTTTEATITLGEPLPVVLTTGVLPVLSVPSLPRTFARGTHLQIVMPVDGYTHPIVTWYKDDKVLSNSSPTLDIASATTADSGRYYATVSEEKSPLTKWSAIADVLITQTGPALLNYSTRAEISPAAPSIISGFVVQSGPSQAMVLIRAVGPALVQFGLPHPLATPKLRVLDASGHEISPWEFGTIQIFPPATGSPVDAMVGAFPLPSGGKDVAHLYLVSPGAYTAEVSSADGGSGTVLLEVYQAPL